MPKLRLFLLLLACGIVVLLGAGALLTLNRSGGSSSTSPNLQLPQASRQKVQQLTPPQKLAATRILIDEQLARAPEFGKFFERFMSAFPAAHKRILDGFVDAALKGSRIESADLYLAQALRGLRSSHGVLAANASPQILERVFELQSATLRALAAQDPKLCADFLFGAASSDFFKFSASNRKLVAAMAAAGLDAIIDGKKNRIERAAPAPAEFEQLEAALRKRDLQKPEIEMLLDAKMPEPALADATVCKAGQAYYDALASLPDELRLKIYALAVKLLARS
jgi:hypothetical protein